MTAVIVIVSLVLYVLLYKVYGSKLARMVKASDDNEAPSSRLRDDVDYVPAKSSVLFGHHFASIAGAAPIIGPVLALAWGWMPALLWIWFGNIFIGAVHDYLAIMSSVRYDGKSCQFVAADVIGARTSRIFYWLVFFMIILVIAAFGAVVGGMYVAQPAVASSYILKLIAALILGHLMYKVKMNFHLATAIGIVLLIFAIIGGTWMPIELGWGTWMIIIGVYIVVASSVPVNILLQPRDYLNSWLLYFGLLIGLVAAVFSFSGFTAPAFTSFAPIISGGKPTPFWPAIVLIIACGSLSGFHALVGSGTTSKQVAKESDVLTIGYGSMLTEGFLSTVVLVSVAGFSFGILQDAGTGITLENWGTNYTAAMMGTFPKASMFVESYAKMVGSTFLKIIPVQFVKVIAGMWVASFAMTTLDTTNRLGRYAICEVCAPLKESSSTLYNVLTNKWIASSIPALIGMLLAYTKSFTVLWPSFSTANQLIASITLFTSVAWLQKRMKVKNLNIVLIPAYLLWITVTAAILWFSFVVLPGTIAVKPITGYTVMSIEVIMIVLNFIFFYDFMKTRKNA